MKATGLAAHDIARWRELFLKLAYNPDLLKSITPLAEQLRRNYDVDDPTPTQLKLEIRKKIEAYG